MPKGPAIKLIETRRGCAIAERESRYDVMLDGALFDQLYYNMTGYVGYLPTPEGHRLMLPERGISAYKAEVAKLNREFAEKRRTA